jgi:hypothetical protein
MPQVFRSMKIEPDGLPRQGQTATTLGVRKSDYDIDQHTNMVAKNGKGMSVSPSCGQLPAPLRPTKFPGGLARNNLHCFRLGNGAWRAGLVAPGLDLCPDPNDPDHGFLEPEVVMLLQDLENAVDATRPNWQII